MPTMVERVLDLWRQAERDLERYVDDAAMLTALHADVERLHWLFRSVTGDRAARRFAESDLAILEAITVDRSPSRIGTPTNPAEARNR